MRQCRQCGRWSNGDDACPDCTSSPDGSVHSAADAADNWSVVARFSNAAEAGYFANELDYVLGVEPRLDCRDDFDAVHHHWRSGFVLSVPEGIADRARLALRSLLETGSAQVRVRDDVLAESAAAVVWHRRPLIDDTAKSSGSTIKWGPLFLTLAAGSLVIWHGKKPQVHRQPAAARDALRIPLHEAPGLRDAPWVQETDNGVHRELDFASPRGTAVLREDRDGDGVFDREYPVSAGE